MKNKFTKLFTLLVMAAMSMGAMADPVTIPQDLGSYIVVGSSTGADGFASYITKTNCQVDSRLGDAGNNKYYTIGSTHSDTKVHFNITASAAGNYVFGFKSGASSCSSVITVKMTKEGSDTPMFTSGDVTIADDGNWDPNIAHNFYIEDLEAANYTLSFEVKEITSGSYAGNFGNFFFHSMSQLAWPTSSTYMELSDGTFHNCRDNSDNVINYISREGGYIDDLLIYNSEESYRVFHFNIDSHKQPSKVTITVTDFETGVQEAQGTKVVTTNGDYILRLATKISAGLKKIRFDFADNDENADDSYLYNFRQVYFTTPDALPLTGEAVLDLSQWPTSGNPRYESSNQNLGYIYHNNTAQFYVANDNHAAHYIFSAGFHTNVSDANLEVTVTDVATGNAEVDAESFDVATGNNTYPLQTFALSGTITPGLKLITFKFTKDDETTSSWLYNINNISFTLLQYTREHPHMNLNTLCFPYQIDTYTGATFYTILSTEVEAGELTKLVLEEHVGALEAGVPYFYDPEGSELVCYYSGDAAAASTAAEGALVGFFDDDHAVPTGSYVTVDNQLYKCGSGVTMGANRAYVTATTYTRAAVPGRRRLTIGGNNMPTGVEEVTGDGFTGQKMLRDGQIVIVKGDKMYNVLGIEVR